MTSLRELGLVPLWVNPEHQARTAGFVLAGHAARALGVMEGERFLGVVSKERLLLASGNTPVKALVTPAEATLNLDEPLRGVAERFVRENLEYAVVMDGERFAGIVTSNQLLRALAKSFDPMTQLSWSDELRQWAMIQLELGHEISIIFVDLDDFGKYNKQFGHVVGDQVIHAVAHFLKAQLDSETDILVRYAGDEFAIGSLRHRAEAEAFADELRASQDSLFVAEGVEPVGFSVGVFGGRRTRERENVHLASTIDNLINRASQECQADKQRRKQAPPPVAKPEIRVVGVYADEPAFAHVTTVVLASGDLVVSGSHTRGGERAEESVALATAKALQRSRPNLRLDVENLAVVSVEGQTVLNLTGRAYEGDREIPIRVQRRTSSQPLVAVAEATIEALAG